MRTSRAPCARTGKAVASTAAPIRASAWRRFCLWWFMAVRSSEGGLIKQGIRAAQGQREQFGRQLLDPARDPRRDCRVKRQAMFGMPGELAGGGVNAGQNKACIERRQHGTQRVVERQ